MAREADLEELEEHTAHERPSALSTDSGVTTERAGKPSVHDMATTPDVQSASGRRAAPSAQSSETSGSIAQTIRRSALTTGAHTSRTNAYMQALVASRIGPTVWLIVGMIPVGVLSLTLGTTPLTKALGIGGLILVTLALASLRHTGLRLSRNPDRRAYNLSALAVCVSVLPLIYFFGAYMPFAGLLGLLILIYNQTAERFWAVLCTGTIAIPHVLLNLALTMGWLPDHGMLTVEGSFGARLMNLFSIGAIYFFSLVLGQFFRKRTTATLEKLEEAAQQVAMREALLREARMELEEAAGVGHPGRFTDQQLGSFVLGNILGRGGMGEIYEAEHIQTGEPAAVKLIRRPESGKVDNVLNRFIREAEIAASLRSPHVVRVLEIGGADALLPYIAMERLHGTDLSDMLREKPKLKKSELLAMCGHVAEGLHAANELGIVHRDIKPRNIYRCEDGTWKLLDFGVARLAGSGGTLTGTNLVGTPGYMAPEQLSANAELDHRTDVHALAAVVYRALTGRPAFGGKDLSRVLHLVASGLPAAPSAIVKVPPHVDVVLRIGLAKNPDERFPDARHFARAFREAMHAKISEELAAHAKRLNQELAWAPTVRQRRGE